MLWFLHNCAGKFRESLPQVIENIQEENVTTTALTWHKIVQKEGEEGAQYLYDNELLEKTKDEWGREAYVYKEAKKVDAARNFTLTNFKML